MKSEYYWPTPGFNGISSYFGYRKSPTKGASTYHKGVDILAYQGTGVSAILEGEVKFAGFDKTGGSPKCGKLLRIICGSGGLRSCFPDTAV